MRKQIALALAVGAFLLQGCADGAHIPDLQAFQLPEGTQLQLCAWSCSYDLQSKDLAGDVISAIFKDQAKMLGMTSEEGRWGASACVDYPVQYTGEPGEKLYPPAGISGAGDLPVYPTWDENSILSGASQPNTPAPTLLEVRLGAIEGGYRVWLSATRPDFMDPHLLDFVPEDKREDLSVECQALLYIERDMNIHQRFSCLDKLLGDKAKLEYEDERLTVMSLPGVVQLALRDGDGQSELIVGWPVIQGGY